jgi:SAM-dependent methyltransferase
LLEISILKSETPSTPAHDADLYFAGNPYERENRLMGDRYADYVLESCSGGTSFLELGIGFGRTVERLAARFSRLTVVDAEPRLIEAFEPRFPDVRFVRSFFESFETSERFEGIGIGFVLDLVDDPMALLRQYAGYLAPRARMYVCIGNAASLHRRIAHAAGLLPDLKQMSSYNTAYGHRFYNTHDEWLALFAMAGLKTTASYGLLLKPLTTSQLQSLNLDEAVYTALSLTARDLPAISNACLYVLEA